MIGNLVNAGAILILGSLGVLVGSGIPERIQGRMVEALGLCVAFLGFSMALELNSLPMVIFSLVLGSVVGEVLAIEDKMNQAGAWVDRQVAKKFPKTQVMKGLIAASLIYCIGSMAILGPIQAGLTGDNSTLFAKAILDGLLSLVLGSSLGIGVALSAIPTFLYQLVFYILAAFLEPLMTEVILADLTATGGLIIGLIGLNLLKITDAPTGNYIPAVFMPILLHSLLGLVGL
ncbi:MAG: DUF554 domain-containing protein [Tissierellia bacterium]|nr:DUF554 domain-containing protein [Tissierellia bacterium]